MIVHVKGRERVLGSFGLTGRRAEWIALGCRHGGGFARARGARFIDRALRDAARRVSASKRWSRRVGSERPRQQRTRLSDAAKVGEPAYPGYTQGLAGGRAPSDPPTATARHERWTPSGPSSRGAAHRQFSKALRERRLGIEVVAVCRTWWERSRAGTVLTNSAELSRGPMRAQRSRLRRGPRRDARDRAGAGGRGSVAPAGAQERIRADVRNTSR